MSIEAYETLFEEGYRVASALKRYAEAFQRAALFATEEAAGLAATVPDLPDRAELIAAHDRWREIRNQGETAWSRFSAKERESLRNWQQIGYVQAARLTPSAVASQAVHPAT